MIYLILSIASSSIIYIIFKLLDTYKLKIFPVIALNYLTAAGTGFLLKSQDFTFGKIFRSEWFYISVLIGILFIVIFYLIGLSSKKSGISITSISTKMSVVFPILFSIFYYGEQVFALKTTGIVLAFLSVFLILPENNSVSQKQNFIFPVILFLAMGLVDTLVKFNQEEFLKTEGVIASTTIVFAVAALLSLMVLPAFVFKKNFLLSKISLLFGISLGLANFGSLYFLILALNTDFFDSSVIFAVNNSAIILISVLFGRFFFKEKLTKTNRIGVFISVLAIIILSY